MKKKLIALCLLVTVLNLSAQKYDHCGTWRWSIKTLTDPAGEDILSKIPVESDIDVLNELPRPQKVGTDSPRFPDETQPVTVRGYIIEHKEVGGSKGDHDYHIVVQSLSGKSQLITEIPSPECPEVFANATMNEVFTELRNTYNEYFGTPKSGKIQPVNPPVEVEITGVPFWDMSGHGGGHSKNGIELHPIIAIKAINPSAAELANASAPATPFFKTVSPKPNSPQINKAAMETPLQYLILILLGGILGTVGQLLRVIVGLKKASDINQVIDYKRTILSLVLAFAVGGVAGVLAAVNATDVTSFDKSTVLAFLAAGYAGTDFIEGFMKKNKVGS